MLLFQLVDWIWNTITEIFQLIFGPFTDPKGANGGGVVGSKELVPMYPSFYTFNPFPHQKHHRKKSEDYELGEGDVGQHEGLDANGMANELHWKQLNNHHHNHHHQAQFYPPPHPALPTATSSHLPQHAHLLYRHFPVHSPHGQYVSIPANLPPSPVHPSHLQVTPTGSPSVNGLPRPHGSISGTEEHSLNPHAVKRRGSKSTANNLVTPSARMSPEVSKGLRKHFGEDFHNNLTKNMNITNHVFVDTVPSLLQKQTSKELSPLHYQSDQQQTSSNMFQHHPDDNMSNIHTFNRGIRGSQPLVSLNRLSLLAKENNHESTRYLELDEGEHPYSQSSSNHDIVIPMASETMSATDPIAALANMSLLLPIIPYDELRGLSDTRNRIGGGAFGSVYKGMWRGTPVAIKLLTGIDNVNAEETAMANKVLQAFVEEVTMLARLRHPNICLLLGVCVEPHHKAIVTEIVSRGSLWDAIRIRQPFQNEQHPNKIFYWPTHIIRRVLEGAGRGLVYLHNHNSPIIHRGKSL